MAVGIKSQEISKGLYGYGRTGNGFFARNELLIIDLQRFPNAAAEI
jgi:hypothetical protein